MRDSDSTVVFPLAEKITGGSMRTVEFARKHGKPLIRISQAGGEVSGLVLALQRFVEEHGIKRLNVAGSRESKEPGIHRWVMRVIEDTFFWSESHPGMHGGPGEG